MIEHTYSTEKILLDRLKIGAQARVGAYVAHNMELVTWRDQVTDDLILSLRSEVLAKTLGTHTITKTCWFESPASTWQMFKHSHEGGRWLGWLARRWPVRMERQVQHVTVEQDQMAVFPEAEVVFPPSLGTPFVIETLRSAS